MSYVIAAPEMMAQAATDLATINSTLSAAHTAAAAPTVTVMPAAADEVSAGVARLFSRHAQDYQARAGLAAAFHSQFMQALSGAGGAYAASDAANASLVSTSGSGPSSAVPAAPFPFPPLPPVIGDFVNWVNGVVNSAIGWLNSWINYGIKWVNSVINWAFGFIPPIPFL